MLLLLLLVVAAVTCFVPCANCKFCRTELLSRHRLYECMFAAGSVPLLRAFSAIEDGAAVLHSVPPDGPIPAPFVRLRNKLASLGSKALSTAPTGWLFVFFVRCIVVCLFDSFFRCYRVAVVVVVVVVTIGTRLFSVMFLSLLLTRKNKQGLQGCRNVPPPLYPSHRHHQPSDQLIRPYLSGTDRAPPHTLSSGVTGSCCVASTNYMHWSSLWRGV